jgi:hypothetical protein
MSDFLSLYFLSHQAPRAGWADDVDKALSRIENRLRRDGHADLLAQAADLHKAVRRSDADGEALREYLEHLAAELARVPGPVPRAPLRHRRPASATRPGARP